MRASIVLVLSLIAAFECHADDAAGTIHILNKTKGPEELSQGQVDVAPGTVSASTLLGLSSDEIGTIANPRDLTMLLKGLDSSNTFGLGVTLARTSMTPMDLANYANNGLLWRAVGATTLSYAQAKTTIQGSDYRQRAVGIETSVYLDPGDDPLVAYVRGLKQADDDFAAIKKTADDAVRAAQAENKGDPASAALALKHEYEAQAAEYDALKKLAATQPCVLFTIPTPPVDLSQSPGAVIAEVKGEHPGDHGPVKPALDTTSKSDLDARVKECHESLDKKARWNPSRAWMSFATGSFQPVSGGSSHGLGRTLVVGATWGFLNGNDPTDSTLGGALTAGYKRSWKEPVLDTYTAGYPDLKNSNLVTLRATYGSNKLRALVEGSNVHDSAPTASERAYKRAAGLDLQVGKGMWLTLRFGRQRRIDNSGDETGSSIAINLSPTAMTLLN